MGAGKGKTKRLRATNKIQLRSPVDKRRLAQLIRDGKTQKAIAEELGYCQSTIVYWLQKFKLKTNHQQVGKRKHHGTSKCITSRCEKHGEVPFMLSSEGYYKCTECRSEYNAEYSSDYRRECKEILVKEHGGKCILCGYKKSVAALHFHHRNPKNKLFTINEACGSMSLSRIRDEAKKCDLLCSRCHAEISGKPVGAKVSVIQAFRRRRKGKLVHAHGNGCLLCRYNKSINALHFHHLHPQDKKFDVSGSAMEKKWEEVWAESCKCVLLCGNCHIETEAGMHSEVELKKLRNSFFTLLTNPPKYTTPV